MNNTNITNKIAEEIVFDPCVEKEQEPTISFLFGSGFSIPAGLPGVKELNKRMGEIKKEEFCISSVQKSFFLDDKKDKYLQYKRVEKLFIQEFLKFYNKEGLSENEYFDCESFYDFYLVCLIGIRDIKYSKQKALEYNKVEKLFVQEFLEFYNKEVLSENECFDYESFYDFYLVYLDGIRNEVFQKIKYFKQIKH